MMNANQEDLVRYSDRHELLDDVRERLGVRASDRTGFQGFFEKIVERLEEEDSEEEVSP